MDITHIKQTPSWTPFVYQFYTTTLGLIMFQITRNRFQQWLAIWLKNNPDVAYLYKLIIQLISLCDNILNIFKEFRRISLQLRGHHKSEAMTGRRKKGAISGHLIKCNFGKNMDEVSNDQHFSYRFSSITSHETDSYCGVQQTCKSRSPLGNCHVRATADSHSEVGQNIAAHTLSTARNLPF